MNTKSIIDGAGKEKRRNRRLQLAAWTAASEFCHKPNATTLRTFKEAALGVDLNVGAGPENLTPLEHVLVNWPEIDDDPCAPYFRKMVHLQLELGANPLIQPEALKCNLELQDRILIEEIARSENNGKPLRGVNEENLFHKQSSLAYTALRFNLVSQEQWVAWMDEVDLSGQTPLVKVVGDMLTTPTSSETEWRIVLWAMQLGANLQALDHQGKALIEIILDYSKQDDKVYNNPPDLCDAMAPHLAELEAARIEKNTPAAKNITLRGGRL